MNYCTCSFTADFIVMLWWIHKLLCFHISMSEENTAHLLHNFTAKTIHSQRQTLRRTLPELSGDWWFRYCFAQIQTPGKSTHAEGRLGKKQRGVMKRIAHNQILPINTFFVYKYVNVMFLENGKLPFENKNGKLLVTFAASTLPLFYVEKFYSVL